MIFQLIDNLTIEKKSWSELTEDERNKFNVFTLHRILSLDQDLIEIVGFIQKYYNIPSNIVYDFWLRVLPKKKIYFKFIKKKDKSKNSIVDILSEFYNISKNQIAEYLNLFSKDDLYMILNGMGYTKDQIKKLLNGK